MSTFFCSSRLGDGSRWPKGGRGGARRARNTWGSVAARRQRRRALRRWHCGRVGLLAPALTRPQALLCLALLRHTTDKSPPKEKGKKTKHIIYYRRKMGAEAKSRAAKG